MMSYKNSKSERGSRKTALADEMFETYRKNHHFSLKKKYPDLYAKTISKFEETPISVLEQMYAIVHNKFVAEGIMPHPNYWVAIINNLLKKPENKEQKIIWGKIL